MSSPEQLDGLRDTSQYYVREFALNGKFDQAMSGFDDILIEAEGVQETPELHMHLALVRAVALRDRGFTRLRQTLHPRHGYDPLDVAEAMGNIEESYQETNALLGDMLSRQGRLDSHIFAEHGRTISSSARLGAAHMLMRQIIPDELQLDSTQAEVSQRFDLAQIFLMAARDTKGGADNAIRAAVFERSVTGDDSKALTWLRRAGRCALKPAVEDVVPEVYRTKRSIFGNARGLFGRSWAVHRMTNWRHV